jgi:nitrile hydratase subunit beta
MTAGGTGSRFRVGDAVTIRKMFPLGHIRTPRYVMGLSGSVCQVVGEFPNPEELAYGRDGSPRKTLYRVRLRQTDVWPNYSGEAADMLEIEIYDHWLAPAKEDKST